MTWHIKKKRIMLECPKCKNVFFYRNDMKDGLWEITVNEDSSFETNLVAEFDEFMEFEYKRNEYGYILSEKDFTT